MSSSADAIAAVCHLLASDRLSEAREMARARYPFVPQSPIKRSYRMLESTRVFLRDGFIDRYSGARLIYPPVLRLLSHACPQEFPFHPNWKMELTHSAYWEVGATIDHLLPVTRGGKDNESNWFTTSMIRNSAKMTWTLEELGWTIFPPGRLEDWDGLFSWFLEYARRHPESVRSGNVGQWHRAATIAAA